MCGLWEDREELEKKEEGNMTGRDGKVGDFFLKLIMVIELVVTIGN